MLDFDFLKNKMVYNVVSNYHKKQIGKLNFNALFHFKSHHVYPPHTIFQEKWEYKKAVHQPLTPFKKGTLCIIFSLSLVCPQK